MSASGKDEGRLQRAVRSVQRTVSGTLPKRIRESYLLKFGVSVAVILTLTGLVGAGAVAQTSDRIAEDTEETMIRQSESVATGLTRWIEEQNRLVRLLSANDVYTEGQHDSIRSYLRRVEAEQLQSDSREIHYIDAAEGEILASSDPGRAGEDLTTRQWYDRVELTDANEVYSSDPYRNENRKTVIAFVSLTNARPDSALVLEAPVADIDDIIQRPYEGAFTQVVNSQGEIVIASNRSNTLRSYLEAGPVQSELLSSGLNGESGFRQDHAKDAELANDHVVGFAPVQRVDWVVIEHAPTAQTRQLQTEVTQTIVALLGVALLGLVVFAVTIGRQTVWDISRLSSKAVEIADGAYNVELETDREDEIGTLFETFDEMRTALVEQISDANQSREQAERVNRQLQIMDRMLRHNVKTDMNIILLRAEMLKRRADQSLQADAQEIIDRSNRLLDTIDKERKIAEAVSPRTEIIPVELSRELENVVESLSQQYPSAQIEYETTDRLTVFALPQVYDVLHELIENAIVHNDQDQPEVTATLTREDGTAQIRIADNGPGIPDVEKQVRTETQNIDPLNHGSGLGLWLIYWFINRVDGTLRFEDNDPRGSVVLIEIPVDKTPRARAAAEA